MNLVSFPGLNLRFEISKIAFSLFGVPIYSYAVCIVLGISIGLILCKFSANKYSMDYNDVLVCTIIGIIFGTIGARIYYVIFNLDYYSKNIFEIFNFRNGGLAIYGGLISGAISIIIYCKMQKINILHFFDYIVPYVAIAQCIGRFGNFFNIEAYGEETKFLLRMGIETLNGYIEVHPVFLYESIATFIIFIILKKMQNSILFEGQNLLFYCLFYSGVRFFLEGLRIDSLMIFNFRISQIMSAVVFFTSLIFIIYNYKKLKNKSKQED